MSEPRRQPAPLVGSHSRSWLGAAALILLAVAVLAAAYLATRPSQPAYAASREAQVRLRLELEAKAREALTVPARNKDGTYRVPIEQAMAILAADNARFESFRQAALKEQAAK